MSEHHVHSSRRLLLKGAGTLPFISCLAALHAFKAAKQKPPINIVLVCEGEEEIGSPNFKEIVFKPEVEAALRKAVGIIIPLGNQSLDGIVEVFNLLNRANYGTWVTNESNARYGQPSDNNNIAFKPRLLQFGFRAAF